MEMEGVEKMNRITLCRGCDAIDKDEYELYNKPSFEQGSNFIEINQLDSSIACQWCGRIYTRKRDIPAYYFDGHVIYIAEIHITARGIELRNKRGLGYVLNFKRDKPKPRVELMCDITLNPSVTTYRCTKCNSRNLIIPTGLNYCRDCHNLGYLVSEDSSPTYTTYTYYDGLNRTIIDFTRKILFTAVERTDNWLKRNAKRMFSRRFRSYLAMYYNVRCHITEYIDIMDMYRRELKRCINLEISDSLNVVYISRIQGISYREPRIFDKAHILLTCPESIQALKKVTENSLWRMN